MDKITPHLWYVDQAVEAANFYVSVFPDSQVDRIATLATDSPSGPAGSVDIVEFTLSGQSFMAISAGKFDELNHAVSFVIHCEDQAEIDHYWEALGDGGEYERCGWLQDRYGLSWQVTPRALGQLLADPDREKASRVADVMLTMQQIDIAELEKAYAG
jgi:predicted 3-demethylubiquinone-9 3-methyltransferase (glyoxalase superfamily)